MNYNWAEDSLEASLEGSLDGGRMGVPLDMLPPGVTELLVGAGQFEFEFLVTITDDLMGPGPPDQAPDAGAPEDTTVEAPEELPEV